LGTESYKNFIIGNEYKSPIHKFQKKKITITLMYRKKRQKKLSLTKGEKKYKNKNTGRFWPKRFK